MGIKTGVVVLLPYEQAILSGFKTELVEVIDEKRTSRLVDKMLSAELPVTNDDGSVAIHTVEEILVARSIAEAIKNPKGLETIRDLQRIRGEAKEVQDVNISLVDARLSGRGFKQVNEK